MSSVRPPRQDEDGVIAVVVALLAVVLFLVGAFVVDLGLGRDTKRQSQNTADAAALAAANVLYGDTASPRFDLAVAAAKSYAASNFKVTDADWTACTDGAALRYHWSGTGTPCISFQNSLNSLQDATRPDTVRVLIPTRNVPTALGRLAGLAQISVSAQAEAGLRLVTRAPCALCVLGERFGAAAHNLQNGDVTVGGGAIHFNGDLTGKKNNKVTADAGQTFTLQGKWLGTGTPVPFPTQHQPKRADPLAFLPPMVMPTSAPRTNPCTDGPGIYGSFSSFPNGTCTLLPGLYVVAGGTWQSSGSSVIVGNGVTLYFTCGTPSAPAPCAGQAGGTLDMTGGSTWTLSAPTSGPLQGQVLRYDRGNSATLSAKGDAGVSLTGTVYGKSATLKVVGGSCALAGSTYHSLMVWDSMAMEGDPACLRVSYLVEQNVPMPPTDMHLTR